MTSVTVDKEVKLLSLRQLQVPGRSRALPKLYPRQTAALINAQPQVAGRTQHTARELLEEKKESWAKNKEARGESGIKLAEGKEKWKRDRAL